ncbi:MAG: 7-carboxy-7-deazaguanine synthase QueE [Bacteroidales bacterium]|nr:7-carboxy-7-deazaguanine synthase QueE [Bacteroidales bacterium]
MDNNTAYTTGIELPVSEEFYSVQGEGCNTGRAAYFIRLAGCDVRCPFCDSKATWKISDQQLYSLVADIAARAAATPCRNVVVTGGEPLMHNLDPLCAALKEHQFSIWLETSGTHRLSGSFDWICVSPKPFKPPLDEVLAHANELKIIVENAESLAMAAHYAQKVSSDCTLLLQAEWDHREAAHKIIFDYVLEHPEWRISIQTHKSLNIR